MTSRRRADPGPHDRDNMAPRNGSCSAATPPPGRSAAQYAVMSEEQCRTRARAENEWEFAPRPGIAAGGRTSSARAPRVAANRQPDARSLGARRSGSSRFYCRSKQPDAHLGDPSAPSAAQRRQEEGEAIESGMRTRQMSARNARSSRTTSRAKEPAGNTTSRRQRR